ncbi:hypothetical protein [Rhizobium sp. BK176]|uniref:hypothetical protein n=1 Tax=Rhizobium sp. BK176 TaxID=2587071 RepID=UPI0021685F5E|nr:hypothetical protein [Rhizobium sp. BK176]MCS4088729.1 plasmid stabilization system protein ParE [Rhizobium sp. BK176]
MTSSTPFWKGTLFQRCFDDSRSDEEGFPVLRRRLARSGCVTVLRIEALPFVDDIERAIAAAPSAEADLRFWQEAWDRSFPDWRNGDAVKRALAKRTEECPNHSQSLERAIAGFIENPGDQPALQAFRIEKHSLSIAVPPQPRPDESAMIARTLRAASAFGAFARLTPCVSAVHVVLDDNDIVTALLTGHDEDGVPRLAKHYPGRSEADKNDPRFDADLSKLLYRLGEEESADPMFWSWDFLHDHLGRTVFGVGPSRFEAIEREIFERRLNESRIMLAGALADMAANATKVAIYTPRGGNVKRRPRRIDLSRVSTIRSAHDLLDNIARYEWAATVEPWQAYRTLNRYFFHDGVIVGSTCTDPAAHPYDGDSDKGFDRRLSLGASALLEDGEGTIDHSAILASHADFAREVGKLLKEREVLDFALDVGTTKSGALEVVAISDLWSAQTYAFDWRGLVETLQREAAAFDIKLEAALDEMASHPDFGRLATEFRDVVSSYGRGAMIARLIHRSWSAYLDVWREDRVKDALVEAMVHYILSGKSNANQTEIDAAEDQISFLHYDGFHYWLDSYES